MMHHTSSLCAGGRSLHSGEGPAVDRHPQQQLPEELRVIRPCCITNIVRFVL